MHYLEIANLAYKKHLEIEPLSHYTGIVTLHATVSWAIDHNDTALLAEVIEQLKPFLNKERIFKCSYINYHCGGNASALLLMHGKIEDTNGFIRECADELLNDAPREQGTGIFKMPERDYELIWIDSIFAVAPFLTYCGVAFNDDRYIEEAFQQVKKMLDIFRDSNAHGTMHQSRGGWIGAGKLSQDHWSRGNGWGLYGMAEMIKFMPKSHPRRKETEDIFRDFLLGCLYYQDHDGMWHQEITDHTSFVETSGTGLILYALGVGIESGIIDDSHLFAFQRGVKGYQSYIALDGSVFNTCVGCLCPEDGSIEAYKSRQHKMNDSHAFGPVIFTFAQAEKLRLACKQKQANYVEC